ncbi:protein kinase domain-containing protein [Dyadobacter psychrophilus]|uniref:Serine/threonine protein kinase n=1 Tax=Dyadobacter psychrophilus TaxID=651661 RepID=A0A1T5E0T9_9BACT|nr:lanthionine synthetase LanC family protein [Dyadobacter psychrophilus]SKB77545.1 serine/threonine protein kinase [Dyadobacter psychrophilus]
MASNQLYILPEDVQVLPVKELPEQALAKFEYEADDFIITYTHARNTSKIVDASSASLLQEFRKPKSLPEGVLTYALLNNLDAQQILEGSYTFLARLRNEGFLVSYDDTFGKNKQSLKDGDKFKDFEIVSKLEGVADTEIYKIKKNGRLYALKLLKTSKQTPQLLANFYNEIDILNALDDAVNPSLTEHGENGTDHYLIMEWVDGETCLQAAEKYHNLQDHSNVLSLLNISCRVLNAYTHLHSQGIIHSDVHPANIIVSESGELKIIDFGLSRMVSKDQIPMRGGLGFFFEPEYAQSVLDSKPTPPSTFEGEQYALGALFYQIFTGKQYLNFSYDKKTLFTQIVSETPVPFRNLDIVTDNNIEKTIFKALAKRKEDRYENIEDFYLAMMKVQESFPDRFAEDKKMSVQVFRDSILKDYGFAGDLLKTGLQLAPKSSVNFGAAGIAYLFLRKALVNSSAETLALADVWSDRAASYIHDPENGFYSKDMDLTPSIVGLSSIYHTPSGVDLVQALVSQASGDYGSYYNAVRNFLMHASHPCENLDLTLGKSAALIGGSLILESMPSYDKFVKNDLLAFGKGVMEEIWSMVDTYAAISEKNPINYRGIAHGWAGILYATLKWCKVSGQNLPVNFFERVEQLIKLGIEEDGILRWEISNTEPASWTGWCHGSAGYTFLWTSLFHFTSDEHYLDLAKKSVGHFLNAATAGMNGSLCCGRSGECYALLSVYNATKDDFYLTAAKRIAKQMLPHIYSGQMKNHSLYKGNIGAAVLFEELNRPEFARMPLFE